MAGRYTNKTARMTTRADEIKRRNDRIAKGTVRALGIRLQLAQAKYASNGENVKDQRGRDDVIQQVAVEIPVGPGRRLIGSDAQTSTADQIPCMTKPRWEHSRGSEPMPAFLKKSPSSDIA